MASTRQRLIDVAMREFAESGDRTVSVSQLARSAGVARGTIYVHLPKPDRLFDVVAEDIGNRISSLPDSWTPDASAPELRVAMFLAALLKLTHEDPDFGRYAVTFAPSTPALYRVWSDFLPGEIRRAVAEGIFSPFTDGIGFYIQLLSGATYAYMMMLVEGRASWRDASRNLIIMGLKAGGLSPDAAMQTAQAAIAHLTTRNGDADRTADAKQRL